MKGKKIIPNSSKKEILSFEQQLQQALTLKPLPKEMVKNLTTSSKQFLSKIYTPVKDKKDSGKKVKGNNENEKSKVSSRSKISQKLCGGANNLTAIFSDSKFDEIKVKFVSISVS